MKTTTVLSASVAALLLSEVCAGQSVAISTFDHDGTITWINTSTQCVAVVEQCSDLSSSDWITAAARSRMT